MALAANAAGRLCPLSLLQAFHGSSLVLGIGDRNRLEFNNSGQSGFTLPEVANCKQTKFRTILMMYGQIPLARVFYV